MKKPIYIFLFILSILVSCNMENGNQDSKINKLDIQTFPTIVDTIDYDKYTFWRKDDEITWLSTAEYHFIYIGPHKDTLLINPKAGLIPPPSSPSGKNIARYKYPAHINIVEEYEIDWLEEREYQLWYTATIEVTIDTNTVVDNSYPVLLKNNESDTIIIGYGDFIPLIMEAKDSTGNWYPIEKPFVNTCGNGVNSIILPPGYETLTLATIFKGTYKTKLRLSIGNNHSPEFNGNIQYRQFESRFTEQGDYKEEYKNEREE